MVKKIIIGTPLSSPVLRYSGVVYDSEDIVPIHAYADTCSCIFLFVPLSDLIGLVRLLGLLTCAN